MDHTYTKQNTSQQLQENSIEFLVQSVYLIYASCTKLYLTYPKGYMFHIRLIYRKCIV